MQIFVASESSVCACFSFVEVVGMSIFGAVEGSEQRQPGKRRRRKKNDGEVYDVWFWSIVAAFAPFAVSSLPLI